MLISSMIPTFMWKINSERIKNTKKNVYIEWREKKN